MLLNYNSKQQQQLQQQQQQQHQQQQLNSQTLPHQSQSTDNNAEDTSNDVSEIGTISDLTTPEAISATNNTLGGSGVGSGLTLGTELQSSSPTKDIKDCIDNIVDERGATTTTSSLTVSCTTPTTTAAIAAVLAAAAANTSATMTPINMALASSVPPAVTTTTTTTATFMNGNNNSCSISNPLSIPTKSSTFDYLYEFSETRKVLEEFFKCPSNDDKPIIENSSDVDSIVS